MMILFTVTALLLLLLWRELYMRLWSKGLRADIRFSQGTAYAGDEIELTEEIANRKRLPLPEVEAAFRIPKGVSFTDAENVLISDYIYKRDILSLRGMESVRRTYHLSCRHRGRYRISQVTLRSWSFFHSRQYEITCPDGDELFVCPAFIGISNISVLCDTLLGTVPSRRSLYEDPFAFAGIREYRQTDSMKQVNWKASARTGSLMVNTFSSVRSQQFLLFLDVSDERILKEEALTEASISAAATLSRQMIRNGQELGLAVNTNPPAVFEPKRGAQQMARIERFLTEDFTGRAVRPLPGLITCFTDKMRDRILVFISKEHDDALKEQLKRRTAEQNCLGAILAFPVRQDGMIVIQAERLV